MILSRHLTAIVLICFFCTMTLFACIGPAGASQTDNTHPSGLSALFEWAFAPGDVLGTGAAAPIVLSTRAGRVAVRGNGAGSDRGEAVFLVLKDLDKSVPDAAAFYTGAMGNNGIVAGLTAIDETGDGYADFVYAGDLGGNLWKLDIRADKIDDWEFAFQSAGTPKPFFTAKNNRGGVQPITTAVDVMRHCMPTHSGYILLFGTGGSGGDPSASGIQSVYALWDWQPQWKAIDGTDDAGLSKSFGEFTRPHLSGIKALWDETHRFPGITGLTLLEQMVQETVIVGDDEFVIMSDHPIDWWHPESQSGRNIGWYFDLPNPGERVIRNPALRDNTATVITAIPGSDPHDPWTSILYMVDACSGGSPAWSRFDVNQDGAVTSDDTVVDSRGQKRRPGGLVLDFKASGIEEYPGLLAVIDPDGNIRRILPTAFRSSGAIYWYVPDYGW